MWNHIRPNPWLFCRVRRIIFYSFYFDSYSGNKNTLKHVCAVGRFYVLACLWIMKFNSFIPYIGTRSDPVANIRNAFFSSNSSPCNISQKFLPYNKNLLNYECIFCVTTLIGRCLLKFLKINNIISVDDSFEVFWIEEFDHFSWNNFVETLFEGCELFVDVFIEEIVCVELTVFVLIILCELNLSALFDKLFDKFLTKRFQLNCKV